MDYTILGARRDIVLAQDTQPILRDAQSALDAMMTARYDTGCEKMIVHKSAVAPDFFVLRTGLAGEVLQKFVNYHMQLAIVGDFSELDSKPLRDFIRESNRGKHVFFVESVQAAVEKLEGAQG